MLTNFYQAAFGLLANGSITDPNSALIHPGKKYTHTQIVGGVIFDVTVIVILLGVMFYIGYREYGSPTTWFRRRTAG